MHVQRSAPKDFWREDVFQFAIDAACDAVPGSVYSDNDYEYQMALTDDGRSTVYRLNAPPDSYGGEVHGVRGQVTRVGNTTTYEVAVPWRETRPAQPEAGASIGLSVGVCDKDEGEATRAGWGAGLLDLKRPISFGRVRLAGRPER
jgi:hypothetical protein